MAYGAGFPALQSHVVDTMILYILTGWLFGMALQVALHIPEVLTPRWAAHQGVALSLLLLFYSLGRWTYRRRKAQRKPHTRSPK